MTPRPRPVTIDIHRAGAAHSNGHNTTVAAIFRRCHLSAPCAVGKRAIRRLVDRHPLGPAALFETANWLFASALGSCHTAAHQPAPIVCALRSSEVSKPPPMSLPPTEGYTPQNTALIAHFFG